jgi:hypothetical protein
MSDRVDARGCLTPTGVRELGNATPGQAPADLALHVAACPRCQQRLLASDVGPRQPAPARKPMLGWALAIVIGGLLVALLALMTVRYLSAPAL